MIPLDFEEKNGLRIIVDTVMEIHAYNYEDYVQDVLNKKGIKAKKNNGLLGMPDFTCEYENQVFFVEVKGGEDQLQKSQKEWILSNSDQIVYIYKIPNARIHDTSFDERIMAKL